MLAVNLLTDSPIGGIILRALGPLLLGMVGVYLLLPKAGRLFNPLAGAALVTLGLVGLVTLPVSVVGGESRSFFWGGEAWLPLSTFGILAALSVGSAVLMITSRNPVYSALWFAMVLLGNSGLYFTQGAEFLSGATVIVYAGAVIVTFLFVIMLAQPKGFASYDRTSREPVFASVVGLLMGSALIGAIHFSLAVEGREGTAATGGRPSADVVLAAVKEGPAMSLIQEQEPHVLGLGKTLYVDHVVSIEIIGVLLLVAVVGAMLIASHKVDPRTQS